MPTLVLYPSVIHTVVYTGLLSLLRGHRYLHLIRTTPLCRSSILFIIFTNTTVVTITAMRTDQAEATLRQQHGRHTNAHDCTLAHTMELPCLPASRPGVRLAHPGLPQLPAQCCTDWYSLLSAIGSSHPLPHQNIFNRVLASK